VPVPEFVIATLCAAGLLPPTVALKLAVEEDKAIAGAGAGGTGRGTVMACGLFVTRMAED